MRFRFRIIDTAAAIIVLLAIFLPPGKRHMEPAYKRNFVPLHPQIARAQADMINDPQDGDAVYSLSRLLIEAEEGDLAGQVAAVAADRHGAWEAYFALAVAHLERLEVQPAYIAAISAEKACREAGRACGPRDHKALEVYLSALKAGFESGADPRTQPTEFIQAIERVAPVMRRTRP